MSTRKIIDRTRGHRHGPITRVVSPSDDIAEHIKPFVFLDYFNHNGKFDGFGMHPHSGIATLTYMLEGEVDYIDTSGKTGIVKTGGLEWMRAGGGAWHGGNGRGDGQKRGFQLWVSLPPIIEDGPAESFYASPENVKNAGPVRPLLGSYGSAKSPFETPASMNYFHVHLKDGEHWRYEPPKGHTVGWVYPYEGSLKSGNAPIPIEELAVFESSESVINLRAVGDASFMFGSAIKHRHPLVLGRYSVHTNAGSLRDSEARIMQIGDQLRTRETISAE
jgi:redox-sensitive bicupin YhaK (pirin superfamily)